MFVNIFHIDKTTIFHDVTVCTPMGNKDDPASAEKSFSQHIFLYFCTLKKTSGCGVMVAAPDLGSGGESRGGSSPPIRTRRLARVYYPRQYFCKHLIFCRLRPMLHWFLWFDYCRFA